MKRNKELIGLTNPIKGNDVCISGVPEGEERDKKRGGPGEESQG